MKSSDRKMKLLLMLQSKKKLSVNDLAKYFDVSRRTIFRDLRSLQEINVPVTWDKYSGYGIMKGYTIPPLMFTAKQLATIMMGLSFVKSQIDESLVEDAKDVELKIRSVLPGELKDFMENLSDKTIADPFFINRVNKKRGGDWFTIYSAISQKKSIEFSYTDQSENKITSRTIDPLLMVYYTDHWNVIGFCHTRLKPRNFLLNRMSEIAISDTKPIAPGEYDPVSLLYHSKEDATEIIISVDNKYAESFASSIPAIIKEKEVKNSKAIFYFDFDNLDYINEWLLRFGSHIEVLSPDNLVQRRKELLNKMIVSS